MANYYFPVNMNISCSGFDYTNTGGKYGFLALFSVGSSGSMVANNIRSGGTVSYYVPLHSGSTSIWLTVTATSYSNRFIGYAVFAPFSNYATGVTNTAAKSGVTTTFSPAIIISPENRDRLVRVDDIMDFNTDRHYPNAIRQFLDAWPTNVSEGDYISNDILPGGLFTEEMGANKIWFPPSKNIYFTGKSSTVLLTNPTSGGFTVTVPSNTTVQLLVQNNMGGSFTFNSISLVACSDEDGLNNASTLFSYNTSFTLAAGETRYVNMSIFSGTYTGKKSFKGTWSCANGSGTIVTSAMQVMSNDGAISMSYYAYGPSSGSGGENVSSIVSNVSFGATSTYVYLMCQ